MKLKKGNLQGRRNLQERRKKGGSAGLSSFLVGVKTVSHDYYYCQPVGVPYKVW